MALQNGATDGNGIVGLQNVAGIDQYVTNGSRTLQPDEIALTTSFNSMQAAIATVSPIPPIGAPGDDGANITAALQTNRWVVLQRGATYNIATPINMSAAPGSTLFLNGAILNGNMARTGGTANSVILATPTLSGVGNTTCNGAAVVGARTLAVTAGAGIPNGTFIQLQSAAGTSLTSYYLVIAGGTTNTLTLDRPIQEPWQNLDTVKPVSVMPREIAIMGPGTITGSGDNAVSWVGVRRGHIRQVYANIQGSAAATSLTGGIDLDLGCVDVLVEDSNAEGFNLAANADQFTIGLGMASCESCRFVRCAGRHATTAGILLTNSFSCTVDHCEGTDCGGTGTGIAVSGTAATSSIGGADCVCSNCYVGDNAIGYGVALQTRLTTKSLAIANSATTGLSVGAGATAATDCIFEDISYQGGAAASGGVVFTSSVVRPLIRNMSVAGQTGTQDVAEFACDVKIDGFTAASTNTTTGAVLRFDTATNDSYVSNVNITMKTVNAATKAIFANSPGRVYVEKAFITFGVNGDSAINHASNGIVEMKDIMTAGAPGGTFGYAGLGASSVARRLGRVDFSVANTPWTTVQSDQGTFTTNGAVAVTITFKDIRTGPGGATTPGGDVISWMVTAAGTPAPDQTLSITGATSFSYTGKSLDTSVRGFKVLD